MKFLIDMPLPPALVDLLRAKGHEASHATRLGFSIAPDLTIWDHARSKGFHIVSKDRDFARLSQTDPFGPSLIWLRYGNCSRDLLLERFSRQADDAVSRLAAGQRLVELI
jgi:predicted nuclease of predicted toxin-antitoxin system